MKKTKHLYKNGAKYYQKKKFEERYGKRGGNYVYGAVIGKVKRERDAKSKHLNMKRN